MSSQKVLHGESAIQMKVYQPADKGSSLQSPEAMLWPWIAVAALVFVVAAMIRWSFAHPFGIHWDEALYINEATIDAQRLHHGMLLKLGGRILLKSWGRPPAYRLLALPFVAILPLSAVT